MSDAPLSSLLPRAGLRARPRIAAPYAGLKRLLHAYACLVLGILYLPLIVVAVLSFSQTGSMSFPMGEPTLRWYGEVLTNPVLLAALARSFSLGVVTAVISTALALMLALAFRHDTWMKRVALGLILTPLLLPGVVGGAVLFVFYGMLRVQNGIWTTVLASHVIYVLPFAFLTLMPRVHGFSRAVEEAAVDLGARTWTMFSMVLWPMLRPAILATALFAFTLSFDEFIRTLFVTGFDRTVPVHFWVTVTDQGAPFLPAMAVVIMTISILASAIAFSLGNRRG